MLHALSEWGEAALDELDGMFAFAFYHAATRRVLLARGPLGIKPLYVARVRDAVVFASEVRPVLASGHHAHIERWRRDQRLLLTARLRPALIEAARSAGRLDAKDETLLRGGPPGA